LQLDSEEERRTSNNLRLESIIYQLKSNGREEEAEKLGSACIASKDYEFTNIICLLLKLANTNQAKPKKASLFSFDPIVHDEEKGK
jgi:hypothetical protein